MSVNGTADVDLGDLPVDVLLGEHTVLDVLLSYFVQVLVAIFFFFVSISILMRNLHLFFCLPGLAVALRRRLRRRPDGQHAGHLRGESTSFGLSLSLATLTKTITKTITSRRRSARRVNQDGRDDAIKCERGQRAPVSRKSIDGRQETITKKKEKKKKKKKKKKPRQSSIKMTINRPGVGKNQCPIGLDKKKKPQHQKRRDFSYSGHN